MDVFRDLGIAFAAALMAIYVLLVYETGSYLLPIVIMLSIPLTLIGIMPGFWLLNLLVNRPVGGFANPVFFTATAMIGMIALAGIVVRNGIILIDFIRNAVARGQSLQEAIIEAGAVRFRPIFLTAGTTLLGAWPITLRPDLQRAGLVDHLRAVRLDGLHAARDPDRLHADLRQTDGRRKRRSP